MSARQKLNQAYINGALLLAGVIGASTESWTVFITLTVILVVLSIHGGDIRTTPRSSRGPVQRRGRRH
jgi:hypothetical protein